jgi:hypothetical protein
MNRATFLTNSALGTATLGSLPHLNLFSAVPFERHKNFHNALVFNANGLWWE